MKIKTSELTGAALDWAVAKCEETQDKRITVIRREDYIGHPIERETEFGSYTYEWWSPTRIWAQGGPIIEREGITGRKEEGYWSAYFRDNLFEDDGSEHWHTGPTPLIAAMRCYVASKLGDEVDIPEGLI